MMRPQTTTEPTSKQELAELYLKAVKELFDDEKDKYDMFHQFMTDFLDKRIDLVTAGVRVRELLKGHNNFINVFNLFLPRGYTITPDKDEPPSAKTAQLDIVVSFLDKVKERFCNEEGVYRSFLRIFAVPEARRNREEVYTKVSYHLKDHPDLLEEFKALYYY